MAKQKSKGFNLAIMAVLRIARQFSDLEERRAFLSTVHIYDEQGKEIDLFLKRLK